MSTCSGCAGLPWAGLAFGHVAVGREISPLRCVLNADAVSFCFSISLSLFLSCEVSPSSENIKMRTPFYLPMCLPLRFSIHVPHLFSFQPYSKKTNVLCCFLFHPLCFPSVCFVVFSCFFHSFVFSCCFYQCCSSVMLLLDCFSSASCVFCL